MGRTAVFVQTVVKTNPDIGKQPECEKEKNHRALTQPESVRRVTLEKTVCHTIPFFRKNPMAEWNDEVAENLRKANEPKKDPQEFNLLNELARGAIYRGGQSQQDFMTGYAWGWIIFIGFLVFLFILGSLGVRIE